MPLPRPTSASVPLALLLLLGLLVPTSMPRAQESSSPTVESVREKIRDGKLAEAAEEARRLVELARSEHGESSLEVAESLDVLVASLVQGSEREQSEARELAGRALAIKREKLDGDDPRIAESLQILGELLDEMGERERARELLAEALGIATVAHGANDPAVAPFLYALAGVHVGLGDLESAEDLYRREYEILRGSLAPGHMSLIRSLYGQARLAVRRGDYPRADALYRQALTTLQEHHGAGHARAAWLWNGLGTLHDEMGLYPQALQDYGRALEIVEREIGAESAFAGSCHSNRGLVLQHLGDRERAREEFERALEIQRVARGEEHPQTASTMSNLAVLLQETGALDESIRLHRRVIAIRRKILGEEHPDVGTGLEHLAEALIRQGRDAEAVGALQEAVALKERLDPWHVDLAHSLDLLAQLRRRQHLDPQARTLCDRALAIARESLGEEHPRYARTLTLSALLRAEEGMPRQALREAVRAEGIAREHLRLSVGGLPERQALGFSAIRARGLDVALSTLSEASDEELLDVWDAVLRSRALVLDEMALRSREAASPELAPLRERWSTATRRLANLIVEGPDQEAPGDYRDDLRVLRAKKEEAERELARASEGRRSSTNRGEVGIAAVMASLPPASALISFVRYRRFEARGQEAVPSYLALVARKGRAPLRVALGEAETIEAAVDRWSRAILAEALEPGDAAREAGAQLRRLLWDPLAPHVEDAQELYVVATGALLRVGFDALPGREHDYLLEEAPVFHFLAAERDLVPRPSPTARGEGLLAVGDVDFEHSEDAPDSAAAEEPTAEASPCADFRELRFERLPATKEEIESIARIWRERDASAVTLLEGIEASESAFKRCAPGARVLHLATHGFFLEGRCVGSGDGLRGIARVRPRRLSPDALAPPPDLALSGLALAGSNRRALRRADGDDGILTGREIAALDLGGVDWAVLSACEGGAGQIHAEEGLLGLQRAFHSAGVETLVLNLWPAEDRSTRRWMEHLYRKHRIEGLGLAEAAREASLQFLADRRREGLRTHPFSWGGWLVVGRRPATAEDPSPPSPPRGGP